MAQLINVGNNVSISPEYLVWKKLEYCRFPLNLITEISVMSRTQQVYFYEIFQSPPLHRLLSIAIKRIFFFAFIHLYPLLDKTQITLYNSSKALTYNNVNETHHCCLTPSTKSHAFPWHHGISWHSQTFQSVGIPCDTFSYFDTADIVWQTDRRTVTITVALPHLQ